MKTTAIMACVVNGGFTIVRRGAGRASGRLAKRPPEIGARLSGMAGILHRMRGMKQARLGICALLSWNGVWGQTGISPRLHNCQRIGVGGNRHGR